jgi:hypothetical protein
MNPTNRSIAALFILATLVVQPIATHAMAGRVAQFSCNMVGKTVRSFTRLVGVGIALYPIVKPTGLLDPQESLSEKYLPHNSAISIVHVFGGRMVITAASEFATISAASILTRSPRTLPLTIATAYVANKAVNYAEKNQYQVPIKHITDGRLQSAVGHINAFVHENMFAVAAPNVAAKDPRALFVSSALWQEWGKINTQAAIATHEQLTQKASVLQRELGDLCEYYNIVQR